MTIRATTAIAPSYAVGLPPNAGRRRLPGEWWPATLSVRYSSPATIAVRHLGDSGRRRYGRAFWDSRRPLWWYPIRRSGALAGPDHGAEAPQRPLSVPAGHVSGLLEPRGHLRPVGLLHGRDLHVSASSGASKRWWRVEVGAGEEDDVDGDVVGDHLDDPSEVRRAVVRLLPLHGVAKPRDGLLDEFVQPRDDGVKIWHDPPDPVFDVGSALRWLG